MFFTYDASRIIDDRTSMSRRALPVIDGSGDATAILAGDNLTAQVGCANKAKRKVGRARLVAGKEFKAANSQLLRLSVWFNPVKALPEGSAEAIWRDWTLARHPGAHATAG